MSQAAGYEYIGALKLKDGLFIGDEVAAQDLEFVVANKVTHIINCCGRQVPNHWEPIGVLYLTYYWADIDNQILLDSRDLVSAEIGQFIDEALDNAESVLVHSVKGQSRSCCVLTAYLMKKYAGNLIMHSWSLSKASDFMRARRPDLAMKTGFLQQLSAFERRLQTQVKLSNDWKADLSSLKSLVGPEAEDMLLRNTYINSQTGHPQDALQASDSARRKEHLKPDRLRWIDQGTSEDPDKNRIEIPGFKSMSKRGAPPSFKARPILKTSQQPPGVVPILWGAKGGGVGGSGKPVGKVETAPKDEDQAVTRDTSLANSSRRSTLAANNSCDTLTLPTNEQRVKQPRPGKPSSAWAEASPAPVLSSATRRPLSSQDFAGQGGGQSLLSGHGMGLGGGGGREGLSAKRSKEEAAEHAPPPPPQQPQQAMWARPPSPKPRTGSRQEMQRPPSPAGSLDGRLGPSSGLRYGSSLGSHRGREEMGGYVSHHHPRASTPPGRRPGSDQGRYGQSGSNSFVFRQGRDPSPRNGGPTYVRGESPSRMYGALQSGGSRPGSGSRLPNGLPSTGLGSSSLRAAQNQSSKKEAQVWSQNMRAPSDGLSALSGSLGRSGSYRGSSSSNDIRESSKPPGLLRGSGTGGGARPPSPLRTESFGGMEREREREVSPMSRPASPTLRQKSSLGSGFGGVVASGLLGGGGFGGGGGGVPYGHCTAGPDGQRRRTMSGHMRRYEGEN